MAPLLLQDVGQRTLAQIHRLTTPSTVSCPLLLTLAGLAGLAVVWRRSTLLKQRRELRLAQEELRASEQRWQLALDSAGDGVWDWDLVANRVFYSHRWKAMLGYGADEIADSREEWTSRVHPDQVDRVLAAVQDHLAGRTLSYSSEHRLRCRDGSYRQVMDRGRVVSRAANGRPLRMMGTHTDVTERREIEDALRAQQLEKQAQQTCRLESLGAVAGGIGHEFNNLLAGMLGPLSVARAGADTGSERNELLGEVEGAIRRAQERTRQLLVFANGGIPLKTPTSLAGLLRRAAGVTPVPCRLSLAEHLKPVDADAGQIEQLVTSLLANAAEATPPGGEIEIVAENVEDDATGSDQPGAFVQVRVRDTGAGIDPADLPRIFEPFFSTRPGSSGLGLAAAHLIVRAHRGTISVESAPGRGTTATFRLPAAPAAAGAAVPAAGPAATAGAADSSGHSETPAFSRPQPRVLLIEDDESVRSAMLRMLNRLGYAVQAVDDGRRGVAAFRQAREDGVPFDVVITDLTIPGGMGGREALTRLRAIDPSVRAIVASGYSDDPVLARPEESGFTGVLLKPFDMATLGRVLSATLA